MNCEGGNGRTSTLFRSLNSAGKRTVRTANVTRIIDSAEQKNRSPNMRDLPATTIIAE